MILEEQKQRLKEAGKRIPYVYASEMIIPVLFEPPACSYHEMAGHYNIAIIPARVWKPKDKPNGEGSVGKIPIWINAVLRNE